MSYFEMLRAKLINTVTQEHANCSPLTKMETQWLIDTIDRFHAKFGTERNWTKVKTAYGVVYLWNPENPEFGDPSKVAERIIRTNRNADPM